MIDPKRPNMGAAVNCASIVPQTLPRFDVNSVQAMFLKETGTSIANAQTEIIARLTSQRCNDLTNEFDPVISYELQRIKRAVRYYQRNAVQLDDQCDGIFGVVVDDLVRSHRLRLSLNALISVVGQEPLRSITVVAAFIPADLLDGPGALGFSPRKLVANFESDLVRAYAHAGCDFVRLAGWMELALLEDLPKDSDKATCLQDWWAYRGADLFGFGKPPGRAYCLHVHQQGVVHIADAWAQAVAIGAALREYFPCAHAVMVKDFDLNNPPLKNVGNFGRYRAKLVGNKQPARAIPNAVELAANLRFWARCQSQSRVASIAKHWPELGSKKLTASEDFANARESLVLRRLALAWEDASRVWTDDSKQWLATLP